jgi:hypothetical protein
MKLRLTAEADTEELGSEQDLKDMLDATSWKLVIWNLDNEVLRQEIKYGQDEEKGKYYQEVRDALYRLLDDYNTTGKAEPNVLDEYNKTERYTEEQKTLRIQLGRAE